MVQWLHEFVWGPGMLALFLFVGMLYTIKLRGFALFGFRKWWKTVVGSMLSGQGQHTNGISSFQSACTALAATIGTGNIAGVATALLAGGPGAIFWMWVSAFLGMATAYGETELGMKYRRRDQSGNWISGAMVYLEHGLGCRWLAVIYAILCLLASFGMGSMVQANAVSETFEFAFSLHPVLIGGVLVVTVGKILAGGARNIAITAEKLVPLSAAVYIVASVIVLFIFREQIPGAFAKIMKDAFSFHSASGGAIGFFVNKCVRYGVARGVFSNEAGLGSLAALNGCVEHAETGVQGQWAMFEVFFDTIISCTVTALVILCALGEDLNYYSGNGSELTGLCFERGLGSLGGYVVSMCVALFAFATIIAWYYMGRQAVAYLGETIGRDISKLYLGGYLIFVFIGSLGSMETVWEISDIFNGMMAIPNLVALVLLVKEVRRP